MTKLIVTAVTNNSSINLFPSWSPDGDSLLYTSYRAGQPQVWRISRGARTNGQLLRDGIPKLRGVWGPDNAGILLVIAQGATTDLLRIRENGSRAQRLTRARSLETSPSWSPDASRVAFVSDRSGSPQLYILDLGTREVRRLTFRGNRCSDDFSRLRPTYFRRSRRGLESTGLVGRLSHSLFLFYRNNRNRHAVYNLNLYWLRFGGGIIGINRYNLNSVRSCTFRHPFLQNHTVVRCIGP